VSEQQHTPQYGGKQNSSPNSSDNEPIRTVFITGLPEDVKEREIHNLFRLVPGYEGCRMTIMNQRPVSFASFTTREYAANAIQQLHGIKFDPDCDFILRMEFARANSKVKRLMNETSGNEEKRRRVSPYSQAGYGYQGGFGYDAYSGYGGYEQHFPGGHPMQMGHAGSHSPTPHYPRISPCTTLYVSGIDPSVSQPDLIQIFSNSPGFQRFRLGRDGSHCFLDYADLASSSMALNALNNYQIGAYRLRVDYAKKKMGEPGGVGARDNATNENNTD